ncbi:hypothetical protein H4219_006331 [Mycoemilia scoparia]|uniref:Uncharacterized protein n=1 Tax=Mycoemilia scoparia TaxID=417184 RepID=A0A9W7ZP43_9FUNG|nr:hypothetical protein H4219_006331 [Mycoemilia scoparia]
MPSSSYSAVAKTFLGSGPDAQGPFSSALKDARKGSIRARIQEAVKASPEVLLPTIFISLPFSLPVRDKIIKEYLSSLFSLGASKKADSLPRVDLSSVLLGIKHKEERSGIHLMTQDYLVRVLANPLVHDGVSYHWTTGSGEVVPLVLADTDLRIFKDRVVGALRHHGSITNLYKIRDSDKTWYGDWSLLLHLKQGVKAPTKVHFHGQKEPCPLLHAAHTKWCDRCKTVQKNLCICEEKGKPTDRP